MVAEHVTTDHALGREVLERIVTQADGVPLFIEELTKAVLEASVDPGAAARPLAVPATLQASLMARLDRLPAARQVAQIGAVIGREFSHALLAASALLPEAQLARGLEELTASGLALRRGAPPDAVYTFNHALTRDVAYASLLKGRRQTCHHRIATVLKNFDDGYIEATEPELLAHHFQEAEDVSVAFTYWILAGDVAERHGANQEAVAHYRSAQRLSAQSYRPLTERASRNF
jgi:predicted ATPase